VADVIHGDGRGASFESNLALRALEVRLALDYLLQQSAFAPAIDPERIGAAGQSAGGHTLLTLMGGQDPKGRIPATADPRIKAGFGLVPFTGRWMGMPPFRVDGWYFGQDFAGLRAMRVPFFAVYGEKDESVPAPSVEAAVGAMPGPATAVKLDGETHSLSNAANNDIYTWELLFFDAWLRGDPVAREKLATGTSVRGGVHDHRTITR
jgi:predicted dienelactone hydrolase